MLMMKDRDVHAIAGAHDGQSENRGQQINVFLDISSSKSQVKATD